ALPRLHHRRTGHCASEGQGRVHYLLAGGNEGLHLRRHNSQGDLQNRKSEQFLVVARQEKRLITIFTIHKILFNLKYFPLSVPCMILAYI
ncbi:hypothetical protein PMAYCL1PPCAC_15485, partial [Pristionchus mayeri]